MRLRRRHLTLLLALACLVAQLAWAGAAGAAADLTLSVIQFEPPFQPQATATVQLGGETSLQTKTLDAEAFTILVDGQHVENIKAEPLAGQPLPSATVLVLDESGSMWTKANKGEPTRAAIEAAGRFVAQMGPDDLVAVYAFDQTVRNISDFSSNKAALTEAIKRLKPNGGETALYDAVIKGLASLNGVSGTYSKHVILLSDGGDTASHNTLQQAAAKARASGIRLYAIGIKGDEFDSRPLSEIAAASGGAYREAPDTAALAELYESLAAEIRNQYLLSFNLPDSDRVGQSGELAVRVAIGESTAEGKVGFVHPTPTTMAARPSAAGDDPLPTKEETNLATAFIRWQGSGPVLALLVFAFLLLLGYIVSGVLFPRTDVLAEYADILDNRRKLGPRPLTPDGSRRPGESAVAKVLSIRDYQDPLKKRLEDAGWQIRSSEFALFHVGLVVVVAFVMALLNADFLLSSLMVLVAVMVPLMLLDAKAKRRRKAFEAQIADILVLMSNSLRAGQGFEQALAVVAEEGAAPASDEFRRLLAQQRLGVAPERALEALADRMGSDAFRWVVMATLIQREAGGNLAELYERVGETLREREKLQGEVDTLTAEAKLSAIILIALPFGVAFMVQMLNPEYLEVLYQTTPGRVVVGAALAGMVAGVLWIRRIIDFDL